MLLKPPLFSRCSRSSADEAPEPKDDADGDEPRPAAGEDEEAEGDEPRAPPPDGRGDAGWPPRGESAVVLNEPLLLALPMVARGDGTGPRGDGAPPRGETAPLLPVAARPGTARRRCCCDSWRSRMSFCISCTHESRSIRDRARHSIFLPVGSLARTAVVKVAADVAAALF
jgi:hypothetical protein